MGAPGGVCTYSAVDLDDDQYRMDAHFDALEKERHAYYDSVALEEAAFTGTFANVDRLEGVRFDGAHTEEYLRKLITRMDTMPRPYSTFIPMGEYVKLESVFEPALHPPESVRLLEAWHIDANGDIAKHALTLADAPAVRFEVGCKVSPAVPAPVSDGPPRCQRCNTVNEYADPTVAIKDCYNCR